MFSRGIVGGARDNCKHLARYITSKADVDHAYGQARAAQRKPRELHTCVSDSKWRAMKALNLDEHALKYSEVAFKGRTKRLSQDCSINVIKDDVSKDTPCIINIYLKSPSDNNSRPNENDGKKKEELSWEEVLTRKTTHIEVETKPLKPRPPIQLDADVLRSKLSVGNAGINEECPVRPCEPPQSECRELYAQQRLLCYNVSVYNCKASRCVEYQAEYDSKEVMTKMVDLAQKQGGTSGISRFLSFCKGLLSADAGASQETRNRVRIDATKKCRVPQVFKPFSAHVIPASVDKPKPRISPRTLSNFKLFKTPDTGAQLQRCNFSSKSDSGSSKGGDKGEPKQKDCSKLDESINRIFAKIKMTCPGEAKKTEKTTCEAPAPEKLPRKTSGKDECLEKSIERLKQITPRPAKDGSKAKKEKGAGQESPICGKDPPQAEAPVEKERKAKKICSRACPLPLDATKKETKEKRAVPEREICKRDPPAKKERPICGKKPAARDKSSADADARCKSEIMPKKPCKTTKTERKKEPEESFADKRCIQDGDTPKEEIDGSAPKKEQANERDSRGGKCKRDPCKKYRVKWQQKAAARKKESTCSREKTHESKKDTPPRGCLQSHSTKRAKEEAAEDSCSGRGGKKKEPIGKDDCNKIVAAAKHEDVCGPTLPEDDCEYNKCEGPDDVEQIGRGVTGHTSKCLAQRTPDVKAEPHHVCPEYEEDTPHETIVEARDPPPHDIMRILGRLLDKTTEKELRDYYGDSYPNHTYYMYTREFFYDVNAKLQVCRRPQPHARPKTPTTGGEGSCDD